MNILRFEKLFSPALCHVCADNFLSREEAPQQDINFVFQSGIGTITCLCWY
jgi:hypothetical protein